MSRNPTELFDGLYRDNHSRIYRLALALCGNPQDAEEVCQEAFLRAIRSFGMFRGECAVSTWLYRIAINVAKDHLKQRKKFPIQTLTEDLGLKLEDVIDENPASNPESELLADQARLRCLHSLTECLPLEQRKVFCLAVTLGLPHKTVAEILDCTVGSVKTMLHRARKRWLGYMEDHCQLIKQSNPCNCRQWVRFGLEQGWISRELPARTLPPARAREEIGRLKALREIYQDLYPKDPDTSYVQRIREGIENREWAILS